MSFRQLAFSWEVVRHFGVVWAVRRAAYALVVRSGVLARRMPLGRWSDHPIKAILSNPDLADSSAYAGHRRAQANRFFLSPDRMSGGRSRFAHWDGNSRSVVVNAERILGGELVYFEHHWATVGCPPDWHRNPFTGQRAPGEQHWSSLGDFAFGDVKILWEASRFQFVYSLVRAYARTGDERFAEGFWRAVEDWRDKNPPQHGINWKCGQEASFRVMAWCFGLHAFLGANASSPGRVVMLAEMLAVHGERIEGNIGYALQQQNNHGISEGVGLWTLGVVFPEFRAAERWRERGRKVLTELSESLIYDDGAFSQQSVNYHRVMLHDYLWALRVGECAGVPLPGKVRERAARAGEWLARMIVGKDGETPNYGANDGALVLPLSNCDYRDFRPVVQACSLVTNGELVFPPGPWDEEAFWLGAVAVPGVADASIASSDHSTNGGVDDLGSGPPVSSSAPLVHHLGSKSRTALEFGGCESATVGLGGLFRLDGRESTVFIRCPAKFVHRPGHADLLHCDLWWRGRNVAIDAGTFSYNAAPPWHTGLAGTVNHNTVVVDDCDQMEKASRFLWLPWTKSRVNHDLRSAGGGLSYWEGEHDGYQRLKAPVSHQRAVARFGDDCWVVADRLSSGSSHTYDLHWQFPDVPNKWDAGENTLQLALDGMPYFIRGQSSQGVGEVTLVRAAPDATRGWQSRYYQDREPAISVRVRLHATVAEFYTVFAPEQVDLAVGEGSVSVAGRGWSGEWLRGESGPGHCFARGLRLAGQVTDELVVSACGLVLRPTGGVR